MQGIFYLWRTTLKNTLKDLKKHPAKLIAYIIMIFLIGICFVSAFMIDNEGYISSFRSINELGAIIFALYMFLFITTILQGLASGVTFFKMPDVNLLFVSPTSQRKVLAYGIVKQMGTTLLLSVFILFQASVLKTTYGVGGFGLFTIFAGYFALVFASSMASMAIYSITCGDERKKKIAKIVIYLLFIPLVFSLVNSYLRGYSGINLVVNALNSDINQWIPFVGWIKALTFGGIIGSTQNFALYLALALLSIVGIIIAFIKSDNNYYEDVLGITETMYHRVEDAKKGKVAEVSLNRKVKVKATGINRGSGAATFFYKHLLESKRASRFIFDNFTLMQVAIAVIFSLSLKSMGSIIPIFAMVTYLQFFSSFGGRWVRELKMPFIYMMPEESFKKLLFCVSEGLIKCVVDGILIFVIAGIIIGASPLEVFICILIRITFGTLFIAGNVLSERVLGKVEGKTLLAFLTFLVMILVALPGIIGSAIIGAAINGSILCLLFSGLWNLIVSIIILFSCKNILDNIEQNI